MPKNGSRIGLLKLPLRRAIAVFLLPALAVNPAMATGSASVQPHNLILQQRVQENALAGRAVYFLHADRILSAFFMKLSNVERRPLRQIIKEGSSLSEFEATRQSVLKEFSIEPMPAASSAENQEISEP